MTLIFKRVFLFGLMIEMQSQHQVSKGIYNPKLDCLENSIKSFDIIIALLKLAVSLLSGKYWLPNTPLIVRFEFLQDPSWVARSSSKQGPVHWNLWVWISCPRLLWCPFANIVHETANLFSLTKFDQSSPGGTNSTFSSQLPSNFTGKRFPLQ